MAKEFNTKATFTKGARVISEYTNDMIFEQPRDGLIKQEFVNYENVSNGVKVTKTTRVFTSLGGYDDTESVTILPRNM